MANLWETAAGAGQGFVLFAAVIAALGVIWRTTIRPVVRGVSDIQHRLDAVVVHEGLLEELTAQVTVRGGQMAGIQATLDSRGLLLDDIKAELFPNGGSSLRDAVDRLGKGQAVIVGKLDELHTYSHDFKHAMVGQGGVITGQTLVLSKVIKEQDRLRKAIATRKPTARTRSTDE